MIRMRWPLALAAALSVLAVAAAAAEAPDWDGLAQFDTVSVATSNPDGTLRYTTVWIVVVGGRGYLRTGDTTWGANVARNPAVKWRSTERSTRCAPISWRRTTSARW